MGKIVLQGCMFEQNFSLKNAKLFTLSDPVWVQSFSLKVPLHGEVCMDTERVWRTTHVVTIWIAAWKGSSIG